MDSKSVRNAFLDFFRSKQHEIVSSAPIVVKNDPTLLFTNAGMNQFKDYFLGNRKPSVLRIADTQKCLRVSGKHNDLEEVGHDTYHHTMFEMLGNWSFGDYFKKEAIEWGWEFLTSVLKLDKERLYATVFEGSSEEGLERDNEAFDLWKQFLPDNRILMGSRKDNFWEMGESGPCGPCSEIHFDVRSDEERKKVPGSQLVNTGHPQVIEIWNLVFIQFNRKADGSLENLPQKHVDTGMGFERLCMVVQGKKSNYDTDVFTPLIGAVSSLCAIPYGKDQQCDVAMRVIADHLRAVSFTIADGQLPSNTGAGYVIRRILRRALRYGYTFLGFREPFINQLIPLLAQQMGQVFPELEKQKDLVMKVVREEEQSFLRTLETGILRFEQFVAKNTGIQSIPGDFSFELYDTYGFPVDLTALLAKEKGLTMDEEGFRQNLENQKDRSRAAAQTQTEDWQIVHSGEDYEFTGYDELESKAKILKYRKTQAKGKEQYQLVLDRSPFYAEGGGQVGDGGWIVSAGKRIPVVDTKKENNLVLHITTAIPDDPPTEISAIVDEKRRRTTEANHTATHLLHHVLREVLGTHVEQKGSLVHPEYLRFDFAHFSKMSDDEKQMVEDKVNHLIRAGLKLEENRKSSMADAQKMGAMALFGEKYGDTVRVIRFGDSVELCGGTHVVSTGLIGRFRIVSESAIAAGIRRIECITGEKADEFGLQKENLLKEVLLNLDNPKDVLKSIDNLIAENSVLKKQVEAYQKEQIAAICSSLSSGVEKNGDCSFVYTLVEVDDAGMLRDIAFRLKNDLGRSVIVLGAVVEGKAHLALMISEDLVKEKNLNASVIIRQLAAEIKGGGGGQPFFASAGGSNPGGLKAALEKAREIFA